MLTGSYRKRLDADLVRWVGAGYLDAAAANAIRRDVASREDGFRLPALLGLFGGLLIAASVAAFVAANWEAIPRLAKLGLVLAGIAAAFGVSWRLERAGSAGGAEAASTCGVLVYGAGLALVGQMYHLPQDWPGGALLVALGAFAAALLMRSNGALALAFVAMTAWCGGRWAEPGAGGLLAFLPLYAPALWLALGRENRLVHHLAVLAGAIWLALLPGPLLVGSLSWGLLAYGLAVAAGYVAIGALALDRGGPALLTACLPWGLAALVIGLNLELLRILEAYQARPGSAFSLVFQSYAVAAALLFLLAFRGRERSFTRPLAAGLAFALLVPGIFWSGLALGMIGKIAVAGLILLAAMALVAAGAAGGQRRLVGAGSVMFGIAILVLLWRTIGTLLDQSLFFLFAGAALILVATYARKLFARLSPSPPGEAS